MIENDDTLALRALSCEDWSWLPGMLPRYPKVHPNFWKPRVGEERAVQRGLLPDFNDQATVGLLLFLVRKVYADESKLWGGRIEVHQDHSHLFFVVQPFHDESGALQYETISSGKTEVESLVNALEKKGY